MALWATGIADNCDNTLDSWIQHSQRLQGIKHPDHSQLDTQQPFSIEPPEPLVPEPLVADVPEPTNSEDFSASWEDAQTVVASHLQAPHEPLGVGSEQATVEKTPAEQVPVEPLSDEQTPVEPAPTEPTPVEQTPTEPTSAQQPSIQPTHNLSLALTPLKNPTGKVKALASVTVDGAFTINNLIVVDTGDKAFVGFPKTQHTDKATGETTYRDTVAFMRDDNNKLTKAARELKAQINDTLVAMYKNNERSRDAANLAPVDYDVAAYVNLLPLSETATKAIGSVTIGELVTVNGVRANENSQTGDIFTALPATKGKTKWVKTSTPKPYTLLIKPCVRRSTKPSLKNMTANCNLPKPKTARSVKKLTPQPKHYLKNLKTKPNLTANLLKHKQQVFSCQKTNTNRLTNPYPIPTLSLPYPYPHPFAL